MGRPLQENEKLQWKRWLADLPKLQAVRVNRCLKPVGFGEVKEIQLHLFSDASRLGYSVVAYLRLEDTNNQIHLCVCNWKGQARSFTRNFHTKIGADSSRYFRKTI